MNFVEGTFVGVTTGDIAYEQTIFYVTTLAGDPNYTKYPPLVWNTVSVADLVPSDAKAVRLAGMLVITGGMFNADAGLYARFKCPSFTITDTLTDSWSCEAAAVGPVMVQVSPGNVQATGGGARENYCVDVALCNGAFHMAWWFTMAFGQPLPQSNQDWQFGVGARLLGYVR